MKQIQEIRNGYVCYQNLRHIDVYFKGSKQGETAAVVCLDTGKVIYRDAEWKFNKRVKAVIDEVVAEVVTTSLGMLVTPIGDHISLTEGGKTVIIPMDTVQSLVGSLERCYDQYILSGKGNPSQRLCRIMEIAEERECMECGEIESDVPYTDTAVITQLGNDQVFFENEDMCDNVGYYELTDECAKVILNDPTFKEWLEINQLN